MDPQYEFDEDNLKLVCINFSDEIVGDNEFLMNEDVTIFNSSIMMRLRLLFHHHFLLSLLLKRSTYCVYM